MKNRLLVLLFAVGSMPLVYGADEKPVEKTTTTTTVETTVNKPGFLGNVWYGATGYAGTAYTTSKSACFNHPVYAVLAALLAIVEVDFVAEGRSDVDKATLISDIRGACFGLIKGGNRAASYKFLVDECKAGNVRLVLEGLYEIGAPIALLVMLSNDLVGHFAGTSPFGYLKSFFVKKADAPKDAPKEDAPVVKTITTTTETTTPKTTPQVEKVIPVIKDASKENDCDEAK